MADDVADDTTDWRIYRGDGTSGAERLKKRPEAPPWRQFSQLATNRAEKFEPPAGAVEAVNAALYLRRPILVTGDPGTGKSSLAYSIAHELGLGAVLPWYINSRSTRVEGLYEYDAVARLRDANLERRNEPSTGVSGTPSTGATGAPLTGVSAESPADASVASQSSEDIGSYVTLGPLGTAFMALPGHPRVVLIDEIDKSDIDLPNDLLHVLENGDFMIPELARAAARRPEVSVRTADPGKKVTVNNGYVPCVEFPVVVITSNGERDLPPAFLRRCLRIELGRPSSDILRSIVGRHLTVTDAVKLEELLKAFEANRAKGVMATDQLLNAFFLVSSGVQMSAADRTTVEAMLLRELGPR